MGFQRLQSWSHLYLLLLTRVIMFHSPEHPCLSLEEDFQALMEVEDLLGAQVPTAEEEEETSSVSSSSFRFSFPSTSSGSSSPFRFSFPSTSSGSSSPLFLGTLEEEEVSDARILSIPQSPPQRPQSSCPSSISCSASDEDSSSLGEGDTSAWQVQPDTEFLLRYELDENVAELIKFLLLKYQAKEPITKAEMLNTVINEYEDHFPMIFRKARDFIELVYGISMTEVDPSNHSYVFANTLKLTYDGVLSNDQGMPKTSLLILTLSVIFVRGNCAPEEDIWEVLSSLGVYAGREHFIYGEPRKLITTDFVQEEFLEYRQVPNSDPARYEFLWGPRAYTEISKRKVLEFLAKLNSVVPSSFPSWYKDTLADVEERAHAIIDAADAASAMASASSIVTSSSFSHPE